MKAIQKGKRRVMRSGTRNRKYTVRRVDGGYVATRPDTKSTVKVTDAMIEKTRARLRAGEAIEFRTISYTVAIETVVVQVLADEIEVDEVARVYRKS